MAGLLPIGYLLAMSVAIVEDGMIRVRLDIYGFLTRRVSVCSERMSAETSKRGREGERKGSDCMANAPILWNMPRDRGLYLPRRIVGGDLSNNVSRNVGPNRAIDGSR